MGEKLGEGRGAVMEETSGSGTTVAPTQKGHGLFWSTSTKATKFTTTTTRSFILCLCSAQVHMKRQRFVSLMSFFLLWVPMKELIWEANDSVEIERWGGLDLLGLLLSLYFEF